MKNSLKRSALVISFLLSINLVNAQGLGGAGATTGILAFLIILIIAGIIFVSDSLMQIEARQLGVDQSDRNFSIFPGFKELFGSKIPGYVKKGTFFDLKRGYDIPLEGETPKVMLDVEQPTSFSINPKNFTGLAPIPKVVVEPGDVVKAGDELFHEKSRPELKFVAPVSGEIAEVRRGEKRSIEDIIILADKEQKYKKFGKFDYAKASREEIVNRLLDSGLWTLIRQRPFNTIPNHLEVPRDIFISTFNSAPLAADLDYVVEGKKEAFQQGISLLAKLTEGKVYLGLSANGASKPADAFTEAEDAEKAWFKGPHPSGNVGIQIHHIKPINKGDMVWTLKVQDVITLGIFASEGIYKPERVIALAGDQFKERGYLATMAGANISSLVNDKLLSDNVRVISGDVLSGHKIAKDGFLGFYNEQITVIEEGDEYELFGWLLPITPRPSAGGTFANLKDFKYNVTTNTHGEQRAFVVTGQYEKVLPMDIYPQHLFKSIIVNDFEKMEGLGIYELAEEDVALCEFACTSKQPLQEILKEGLEIVREQG